MREVGGDACLVGECWRWGGEYGEGDVCDGEAAEEGDGGGDGGLHFCSDDVDIVDVLVRGCERSSSDFEAELN